MKQLLITIVLCVGCITAADAQSTFTERLQKSNTGEGKISVTQDKSIDALVNGPSAVTKQPEKENIKPEQKEKVTTPKDKAADKDKASDKEKTAESKDKEKVAPKDNEAVVEIPDTIDIHKKVMKGYKINGYRVQVFAGGNSRNDRLKAERAGENIKTAMPGIPVYVHFYSPRWICRIGNYRTYEEAHEVLIVKGKITVQYP